MPTVKLTAKKLDALKPNAERQVDYFDQSLPGFNVRISPLGRKTFTLMYRFAGKLRRLTIGRYPPLTLADARDQAKDALRDASKGIFDPAAKKRQDRMGETFEDLCKEYLERHAKRKKRSWKED
ncbi:MAG: Arm DNA-binding domain-containing protein, partial [Acidobacteria bacterium]|nr:Arm DNA-binding domain-containing protein [Acidobacteriota bacterium]